MIFDAATPPTGTVKDWLDHHADGAQIAIVFPETGDALTWRALRDEARALAEGLTGLGIAQGESVAIVHPNGRDGAIALYAALYGGFRATMINLAAGPDAIAYALDHSGARFAFVHDSQTELITRIAPDTLRIVTADMLSDRQEIPAFAATAHALLMYTSGTTGQPKGVVHTHASLLAGGWTTAIAHKLTAQDRGFCVLPIYHINGLCVTMMGALVSGGPIVETMGLTETAAQILSNPLPPGIRKIGSPGVGFGNEVCILTPELSPAPPLQEGEIAVRGPNVMLEYLNNPEATAKTFTGDWLRTGDLGHIDEDGYVFVTGRLKELIIKGGENIAPREIDEVLYSQPDIIEAAAFARPCKSYGETVEAAVSVKPGSDLSEVRSMLNTTSWKSLSPRPVRSSIPTRRLPFASAPDKKCC